MTRRSVILFAAFMLLAGCGKPTDPLDYVVRAATEPEYGTWQTHYWSDIPYKNRKQYERAITEIRFFIMRETSDLSPAEQRQRLLGQLNGLKVRTIIAQGMLFANDRLEPMLEHDRGALQRNQYLLDATTNTVDQRVGLLRVVDEIKGRIAATEGEISLNDAVIHEVDPGSLAARAPRRPQKSE